MERRGVSDGSAACSKLNKCEPKENSRRREEKAIGRAFPSALSRQGSSLSSWARLEVHPQLQGLSPRQAPGRVGHLCTPFWQSTTQKHILPVNGPIKKANVFKQEDLLA